MPRLMLIQSAVQYAVRLDIDDMLTLVKGERDMPEDKKLFSRLERIRGVRDVDYDAHFGAAIELMIDAEFDSIAAREAVRSAIENHLRCCMEAREH